MKVFHRGLIIVGVPFLLEMVLIVSLSALLYQSDQDQIKESRYRRFAAYNARMLACCAELPFYIIFSIQYQSDDMYKLYLKSKEQILFYRSKVLEMMSQSNDLADSSMNADSALLKMVEMTDELASVRKAGILDIASKMPTIQAAFEKNKGMALEKVGNLVRSSEAKTKIMQEMQLVVRRQFSQILIIGLIGNAIAAICLSIFYGKGIMARLRIIGRNTQALKEGKALESPLSGRDEIMQLDRAFHEMDATLKLATIRQREMFDNASDVICVLDADMRFTKVNRASDRNWGLKAEDLIEKSAKDITDAQDFKSFQESLLNARNRQTPVEVEMRRQSMESLWSIYWSQIDQHYYCVVHDVSEQKRSERMKQRFLSMISSDLKRPLKQMSSSLAAALSQSAGALPIICVEKLKMAEKNLQRLLGLVDDLLQVAVMESDAIEINRVDSQVRSLLLQARQEVEALSEKRGIEIVIENDPDQSCFVDPNRIIQVLVNLLSNAIKFSPDGAKVFLSARADGPEIVVSMRDEGRGIPESHKKAIFEKFKQVEAADGKRKSGTGLGLPICKQIVEDHGGSIGVDSEAEKGSTFWFRLPVSAESVSSESGPSSIASGTDSGGTGSSANSDALVSPHGFVANSNAAGTPSGFIANSQAAGTSIGATSKSGSGSSTQPGSKDSLLLNKDNPAGPFAWLVSTASGGKLKLPAKGLLLIGLPLIFELILVGALSFLLFTADKEREEELYQRTIAIYSSKIIDTYFIMSALLIAEKKTPEQWFLVSKAHEGAASSVKALKKHVRREKEASSIMSALDKQSEKIANFIATGDELVNEEPSKRNVARAIAGKDKLVPSIVGISRKLQRLLDSSEKKEFVIPERRAAIRAQEGQILAIALLCNIFGSILLALFFSRDLTGRLQILADNAMRLAATKKLNSPIGGKDEIAELDRMFHDSAAALKEAQQKESAVFDNAQDLILSISSEGIFLKANQASQRILGYAAEELCGKSLEQIVHPEDLASVINSMKKFDKDNHELESRVLTMDGPIKHMHWSLSKSPGSNEVYCILHDITERKELESLKHEFLAMVSHDLRTPLTSILGVAKLATAGAFGQISSDSSSILLQLTKSGDKLLELINDLLDIEKLDAGKMQLVHEKISLAELLSAVADGTKNSARIRVHQPEYSEQPMIEGDKDRLIQALSNLIHYALSVTPEDRTVEIRVVLKEDGLNLEIIDGAEPLSQAKSTALFDRFSEHAQSNPDETVAGLALPIARRIIEGHSGQISNSVNEQNTNTTLVKLKYTLSQTESIASASSAI